MANMTKKSEENQMISKAQLKKLIEKGKKHGVISFAEINDAISDDVTSSEQMEDIVVQFKELGITLVDLEKEKSKNAGTKTEGSVTGKPPKKKEKIRHESKPKKSDTAEKKDFFASARERPDMEFGAVTDPVKMYLKEMGMVTL